MKILQIIGGKKSGKTTTMVDFITEASRLGYKVTALKRAHEATFDSPNTDSYRFSNAGAAQVGLSTPAEFLWHEKGEISLADLLKRAAGADVVFIEGFRVETGFPRLTMDLDATIFPEKLTTDILDFTDSEKRKAWLRQWLMN